MEVSYIVLSETSGMHMTNDHLDETLRSLKEFPELVEGHLHVGHQLYEYLSIVKVASFQP